LELNILTSSTGKLAMKQLLRTFTFLLLVTIGQYVQSYSMQEIFEDSLKMNMQELVPFRGPILKDTWLNEQHQSKYEEINTCKLLFMKGLETVSVTWPPPTSPPEDLVHDYTMGGKMEVVDRYFAEKQNGGTGYKWTKELIDDFRRKPNTCGGYKLNDCEISVKKHRNLLFNRTGIVVGSQSPWAEAALLNAGVKSLLTIEYMKIETSYPGLSSLHPSEAARAYLDKKWEHVDFAFTYSSLEHDGLGRYGDPMNPFGDLESVGRIRCLLKPGGILMLGVPVGFDTVVWNAHRVYGKYRLALISMGWQIIDSTADPCIVSSASRGGSAGCQPIIILQKPFGSSSHHNHYEDF
jgi:hypothetical protein